MAKLPRQKERVASPEEPDEEGSMALALRCFAAWGRCPSCKRRMLFLADAHLCGPCTRLREALGEGGRPKARRRPANDNAAVLSCLVVLTLVLTGCQAAGAGGGDELPPDAQVVVPDAGARPQQPDAQVVVVYVYPDASPVPDTRSSPDTSPAPDARPAVDTIPASPDSRPADAALTFSSLPVCPAVMPQLSGCTVASGMIPCSYTNGAGEETVPTPCASGRSIVALRCGLCPLLPTSQLPPPGPLPDGGFTCSGANIPAGDLRRVCDACYTTEQKVGCSINGIRVEYAGISSACLGACGFYTHHDAGGAP